MLLLTCIQDRWKTFDLNDLTIIKNYVFNVHKYSWKVYFCNWLSNEQVEPDEKVGKNLFRPNNKALAPTICRVSIRLQRLHCKVVKPYLSSTKRFTFNDATLQTFFKWSQGERLILPYAIFETEFWIFLAIYERRGNGATIRAYVLVGP